MTLRMSLRRSDLLTAAACVAGAAIKIWMLSYIGVFDMDAYHEWGTKALESGLPATFHGIYFPLQYQIFEVCAWIAARLGVSFVPVFKLSNLVFDVGSFVLLLTLLKRRGASPWFALLYWLHPWFLSVFSLGYIDFQFSFFVLACIAFLRREGTQEYLLAGLVLGLAFMMKPQAQVLVIAAFLFALLRLVRRRDVRPLAIMAGPVVFFLGYEVFFTLSLYAQLGMRAAAVLPLHYLNVSNVMPCLTAQMPNIWYPVAYFLKQPAEEIYAVSDQMQLFPGIPVKYLAAAAVLGCVGLCVHLVEKKARVPVDEQFTILFGFSSLVVPLVMTSAHENHLFLGSVFLILILAGRGSWYFAAAGHALLLIQFLNLYGLYGERPILLAGVLRRTYSQELALAYSVVSVVCFVTILVGWNSRISEAAVPGYRGVGLRA